MLLPVGCPNADQLERRTLLPIVIVIRVIHPTLIEFLEACLNTHNLIFVQAWHMCPLPVTSRNKAPQHQIELLHRWIVAWRLHRRKIIIGIHNTSLCRLVTCYWSFVGLRS